MSEDQFLKLFKYMEKRFDGIDARFDKVDIRFDATQSQIDGLAKLIVEYHQEMVMLTRQVDRMREAIKQIAKETGIKLAVDL